MTVIGICGGSASGKSTLAGYVAEARGNALHVSLDDFYKPIDEQPKTFDDPSALRWEDAHRTLQVLTGGHGVRLPVYDFETGTVEDYRHVRCHEHIVIEGLWTLYSRLRPMIDVGVYIETPLYERVKRRVLRDTEERGTSVEDAFEYFEQALEKEKEHVEFQRDHADIIVPGRPTKESGETLRRLL